MSTNLEKKIVVISLQVTSYFIWLPELNLLCPGLQEDFIKTPLYYRPSLFFQLAHTSLCQELYQNSAWASFTVVVVVRRVCLDSW